MGTADLVVLVSMDGLRPDVVSPDLPGLHQLYLQGAWPRVAKTIDKSATLPSHASMVSGVEPGDHGINFNAFRPSRGVIEAPTIFSMARHAGLPSQMFVGKGKLRHLLGEPEDAAFTMGGIFCRRLLKKALPALERVERGVFFIHLADPDGAGHRYGWMTDEYIAAVRAADRCLERVIETIERGGRADRTLLVVTSDHGGHGRSHGTRLDVDQRIPWYAWGAGVERGRLHQDIRTVDTAATVLAALGIARPEGMLGQPVAAVLQGAVGPMGLPFVGAPIQP